MKPCTNLQTYILRICALFTSSRRVLSAWFNDEKSDCCFYERLKDFVLANLQAFPHVDVFCCDPWICSASSAPEKSKLTITLNILKDITLTCLDIDECPLSPCDENANCTDTVGSFECKCNDGYSGSGKTCEGMKTNLCYGFSWNF